jgi:hypothetical protein
MKTKLNKLQSLFDKTEDYMSELSKEVNELCSFESGVSYVSGEGVVIISNEDSNVATINCLEGKTNKNKLTKKEFLRFSI